VGSQQQQQQQQQWRELEEVHQYGTGRHSSRTACHALISSISAWQSLLKSQPAMPQTDGHHRHTCRLHVAVHVLDI
jgi:hypothetical protein